MIESIRQMLAQRRSIGAPPASPQSERIREMMRYLREEYPAGRGDNVRFDQRPD